MKKEQILLIISIMGIIILLILINFQKPILTGKISSIKTSADKTTINLENHKEIITIQNKTKLNLQKNDFVKIYGRTSLFKNQTFIFPDKITK
jgi:hypothetical protein